MLRGLGLAEADIQHVIGNYQELMSDAGSGLQIAQAGLGERTVRVLYRADEEGLVVVSVQVEVTHETGD
jgi:hypothetical protein